MVRQRIGLRKSGLDVRFGSSADICSAKGHVRFDPNSDRKSGHSKIELSLWEAGPVEDRTSLCSSSP